MASLSREYDTGGGAHGFPYTTSFSFWDLLGSGSLGPC